MFTFMNTISTKRPPTQQNVKDSVVVRPVESIAGSLVDEMRTLMFGRSFIPSGQNTDHRKSHHKSVDDLGKKTTIVVKKCEDSLDPKAQAAIDTTESFSSPETPQEISSKVPSSPSTIAPSSPTSPAETTLEDLKPESSRRKKKSKGKHRRKSERSSEDSSIEKSRKGGSLDDQSTLPNHILIQTFTRVMDKGLVLNLLVKEKQSEMTFWIENKVLRWGKQKQNGKERGSADLKNLCTVEDIGPLEIRMEFINSNIIDLSVSSSVEKTLLLRSFLLAIETGMYQ